MLQPQLAAVPGFISCPSAGPQHLHPILSQAPQADSCAFAAYALGFLNCNNISARCMLNFFQFFAIKADPSALRKPSLVLPSLPTAVLTFTCVCSLRAGLPGLRQH